MDIHWRSFLKTLIIISAVALSCFIFTSRAFAQGEGQVIVELRNNSPAGGTSWREFPNINVQGTDSQTKKEYKFKRVREGTNFSYVLANLRPSYPYNVEMSFVEPDFSSSGKRVFNVYLQGSRVLQRLDIFKTSGGKNRAYQRVFSVRSNNAGRLYLQFRSDEAGCAGKALICTIRVFRGASTEVVEISASASRQMMSSPVRFENGEDQNCFETLLGRLGSRFCLNFVPQRLAARISSLGAGTWDLNDLVLALKHESEIRALPFTDRYPVWESIDQRQTMTSHTYDCSSQAMPLKLTARFRAPFYPGEERISSAPVFFLDLTVQNRGNSDASGELLFAIPHKRWFESSQVLSYETGVAKGYMYKTVYSYNDETIDHAGPKVATEAVLVPASDSADIEFKGIAKSDFEDFTCSRIWDFYSPQGYPVALNDWRFPFFTFFPRGYTGFKWRIENLPPGGSAAKRVVLAGYISQSVLRVKNSAYDDTYELKYTSSFGSLSDLITYAFNESGDMISKSAFFDSTIASRDYLYLSPTYVSEFRNLYCYAFQSFVVNTWWALSENGREWFSTWEGADCRFHSTVDVEYNNAWFYFHYFPDLLKRVMDQWILYLKECGDGFYLSHDMGRGDFAGGQVYPHDMPAEENANYILLLYKYWKTTGDGDYVKRRFSTVRLLLDFLFRCDTNNNGIPDIYTANTIDDASFALQFSKDQTYLGLKCLSAYYAASRLAEYVRDWSYYHKCRSRVMQINQTLQRESWLSDRFAVSLDSRCPDEERDAYSIFASNGLVYLLSSEFACGLSSQNIERVKKDLASASERTKVQFGSSHTSYDRQRQWISQNMWRDQAALYLGVAIEGQDPMMMVKKYWAALLNFARYLNGGYWDVVIYPGAKLNGASFEFSKISHLSYESDARGVSETMTTISASADSRAPSLGQALGYYPRGAAVGGLLSAAAGVSLDVPGGRLFYKPAVKPVKIPIFEMADWQNSDPAARIPVISFAKDGAVSIRNRHLLPPSTLPRRVNKVPNTRNSASAISQDGDGINDSFEAVYSLSTASRLFPAVWEGRHKVRSFGESRGEPGEISVRWDGKDDSGRIVDDGLYCVGLSAAPTDKLVTQVEDFSEFWVNRTIPNLSKEWYLAEGYTAGGFETYILIQNPNTDSARVEVRFMLADGQNMMRDYIIGGKSRFTIHVDSIFPESEVSAHIKADKVIAVERAMYFNEWQAGHASVGAITSSQKWYFAEGCTAHGFDTYILICNPEDRQAQIKATFMTPAMGNIRKTFSVSPRSRFTIWLNDILPERDVSTLIESSVPVIAERAQYFNNMKSGTCSTGAVSTSRTWFLAEGCTGYGFEEYILVQNPSKESTSISVRFMRKDGSTTLRNYDLPGECRFTIGVNEIIPESDVSARVTSSRPVLVERAMYWKDRSDGHACLGTPSPDTSWYLAEGYTGGDFETWILVQNPSDEAVVVSFTFMEPNGSSLRRKYKLKPQSRFTLRAKEIIDSNEFSTELLAEGPVIVERAVYFANGFGGTCAPGIRGCGR